MALLIQIIFLFSIKRVLKLFNQYNYLYGIFLLFYTINYLFIPLVLPIYIPALNILNPIFESQSFIYIISVIILCFFSYFLRSSEIIFFELKINKKIIFILLTILFVNLLLVFKNLDFENLLNDKFEKNKLGVGIANGLMYLTFYISLFWVFVSTFSKRYKIIYIIAITLLASILTLTKSYLFFALIMIFLLLDIKKRRNFILLFIISFSLFASPLINMLRSNTFDANYFETLLSVFDVSKNENEIITSISSIWEGHFGFLVYFQELFISYIPRSIYDSKPEVYGFWLIQKDLITSQYFGVDNQSVSPGFVGESLASFGIIDVFLKLFFFIFIIFKLEKNKKSLNNLVLYLILIFNCNEFVRGGLRMASAIIFFYFAVILSFYLLKLRYK